MASLPIDLLDRSKLTVGFIHVRRIGILRVSGLVAQATGFSAICGWPPCFSHHCRHAATSRPKFSPVSRTREICARGRRISIVVIGQMYEVGDCSSRQQCPVRGKPSSGHDCSFPFARGNLKQPRRGFFAIQSR